MKKVRVLFVCEHNSARSQMAEAWANYLFGEWLEAESAGLEAGKLNPLVIRVMEEVGIDISQKGTQSAFDLVKAGRLYSYVVTLCEEPAADRCPFFPGITQRLHWSFPAPSQLGGSEEEKLIEIRKIRDSIRQKIEAWAATIKTVRPFYSRFILSLSHLSSISKVSPCYQRTLCYCFYDTHPFRVANSLRISYHIRNRIAFFKVRTVAVAKLLRARDYPQDLGFFYRGTVSQWRRN